MLHLGLLLHRICVEPDCCTTAQVCAKEGTWRRSSRMEWVVNNPPLTRMPKNTSPALSSSCKLMHTSWLPRSDGCHPWPQSMNLSVPPKDESWVYASVPRQRNWNLLKDNFRYIIKIQHQCVSQQSHINYFTLFYCTNQIHSIYLLF